MPENPLLAEKAAPKKRRKILVEFSKPMDRYLRREKRQTKRTFKFILESALRKQMEGSEAA